MHLGLKISGVELAFLLTWWHGYSLNNMHRHTGITKCTSLCMVLLIFAPQVYANLKYGAHLRSYWHISGPSMEPLFSVHSTVHMIFLCTKKTMALCKRVWSVFIRDFPQGCNFHTSIGGLSVVFPSNTRYYYDIRFERIPLQQ